MEIATIALQGLGQAQSQLEHSAGRLASLGVNSPDGTPVDTVDLSQEMVSILSAKNAFAADIKVLKVANQMQNQLIDLFA